MEFQEVPAGAATSRPWAQKVDIGPPPGVDEEECGTASALVEPGKLGDYTVNEFRTYFKPTKEELKQLNDGGHVVFVMLCGQMVAHHAEVFYEKPQTAPPHPVDAVVCCPGAADQFVTIHADPDTIPALGSLDLPIRLLNSAEKIYVRYSDGSQLVLKNRNGEIGFIGSTQKETSDATPTE